MRVMGHQDAGALARPLGMRHVAGNAVLLLRDHACDDVHVPSSDRDGGSCNAGILPQGGPPRSARDTARAAWRSRMRNPRGPVIASIAGTVGTSSETGEAW